MKAERPIDGEVHKEMIEVLKNCDSPRKTYDFLDALLQLQKTYTTHALTLGKRPTNAETLINYLCTAIVHEAIELQRLTNWKWWKQPVLFDTLKAREELIDILHFVLDACLALGMDAQQVFEEYYRKNATNRQRIRDRY